MTTRKLTIHIGLPKTGSSAIQTWLSANVGQLAKHGITYADLAPNAKLGAITSGNGSILRNLLRAKRTPDPGPLLDTLIKTYFAGREEALISSELLVEAEPDRLRLLSEFLLDQRVDTIVVAFVRDIYPLARSFYAQAVKRHGYADTFDHYVETTFVDTQLAPIDRWSLAFANLRIMNYSNLPSSLEAAASKLFFENRILTEPGSFQVVNRSLNTQEMDFLLRTNAKHGRRYSRLFSDVLLAPQSASAPRPEATPAIIQLLETRFQPIVDGLNTRYLDPMKETRVAVNSEGRAATEEQNIGKPPDLERVVDTLIGLADRQGLEIQLLSAQLAQVRGDFIKAREHANNALALAPGNAAARDLQRTLQSATVDDKTV